MPPVVLLRYNPWWGALKPRAFQVLNVLTEAKFVIFSVSSSCSVMSVNLVKMERSVTISRPLPVTADVRLFSISCGFYDAMYMWVLKTFARTTRQAVCHEKRKALHFETFFRQICLRWMPRKRQTNRLFVREKQTRRQWLTHHSKNGLRRRVGE